MSIKLPPLPSWSVEGEKIANDGRYVHLYDGDDVEERDAIREARERILLARVEHLELTVQELGLRNADLEADAERYRWLAKHGRSTSEHWGGRWSIAIEGPCPKSHNSEVDFDAAIDAARGAK